MLKILSDKGIKSKLKTPYAFKNYLMFFGYSLIGIILKIPKNCIIYANAIKFPRFPEKNAADPIKMFTFPPEIKLLS